jgi:hypothetical protein
MKGLMHVFSTSLRLEYSPLRVTEESIRKMTEAGFPRLSEEWRNTLDGPLTSDEIRTTIIKRNTKKAPGRDGIGLSLFQATWNALKDDWIALFSQMFVPGNLTEQQKRGVVVFIPKTMRPSQPSDYRPITLLNTDYKILARVVANRIRPAFGGSTAPKSILWPTWKYHLRGACIGARGSSRRGVEEKASVHPNAGLQRRL